MQYDLGLNSRLSKWYEYIQNAKCETYMASQDYDTIIGSCKVLSSRVSVYCARFNGSIVPFTLSSAANVGVDQKLKLVDKYIGVSACPLSC